MGLQRCLTLSDRIHETLALSRDVVAWGAARSWGKLTYNIVDPHGCKGEEAILGETGSLFSTETRWEREKEEIDDPCGCVCIDSEN
jgi:hypothetical protein